MESEQEVKAVVNVLPAAASGQANCRAVGLPTLVLQTDMELRGATVDFFYDEANVLENVGRSVRCLNKETAGLLRSAELTSLWMNRTGGDYVPAADLNR